VHSVAMGRKKGKSKEVEHVLEAQAGGENNVEQSSGVEERELCVESAHQTGNNSFEQAQVEERLADISCAEQEVGCGEVALCGVAETRSQRQDDSTSLVEGVVDVVVRESDPCERGDNPSSHQTAGRIDSVSLTVDEGSTADGQEACPGEFVHVGEEGGSLGLSDKLQELRRVRYEYETRMRRSAELRAAVDARGQVVTDSCLVQETSLAELRARLKGDVPTNQVEERLLNRRNELHTRTQDVKALEVTVSELDAECERAQILSPTSAVLEEVLQVRRAQLAKLRENTANQEIKIRHLHADLKKCLDFMVCTNIEATGGPTKDLGPEDFLPGRVRDELNLSEQGQRIVDYIMQKFEMCMEERDHLVVPAVRRAPSQAPLDTAESGRLPPTEHVTDSFADEVALLRERLTDEMQSVANVLQENDQELEPTTRERRELLRVAAWGDRAALKDVLMTDQSEGGDDDLLGWTAWHAAVAHGQLGVLADLVESDGRAHHCTISGLPPLAIACLLGQTEAVQMLLSKGALIECRDKRGNTPVHWAAAVEEDQTRPILMRMLCEANADVRARNFNHQCIDLSKFDEGTSALFSALSSSRSSGRPSSIPPCVVLQAIGAKPKRTGILSYTLSMISPPVRDAVNFMKNAAAKSSAQLSSHETDMGVFSDTILNYTHGELKRTVDPSAFGAEPSLHEKSEQVLVLTCERILFFQPSIWRLLSVIELSEVKDVVMSTYSDTVFVLRTKWFADVLIDMESRGRFLEELRLAIVQVAKRWGTVDPNMPISITPEPICGLENEHRQRLGTLVFVESNMLVIVPYAPDSLLLSGDTFFFGFLALTRFQSASSAREWQSYFFVLKTGLAGQRRFMWCHHPNDASCVTSLPVEGIQRVEAEDGPDGSPCIKLSHSANSAPNPMTLRAKTAKNRDDWIAALRTLNGGMW